MDQGNGKERTMRATLVFVIEWLGLIDAWHEFKFSDRQKQTIAPEFQDFGERVLNEVLSQVKQMPTKPSPARLMSMCKDVQTRFLSERQLNMPDEDPSTWMTSTEYARSQGYNTLKELIKSKIEEQKVEGTSTSTSLDPSIEKQIDFWDSLGEKSA